MKRTKPKRDDPVVRREGGIVFSAKAEAKVIAAIRARESTTLVEIQLDTNLSRALVAAICRSLWWRGQLDREQIKSEPDVWWLADQPQEAQ